MSGRYQRTGAARDPRNRAMKPPVRMVCGDCLRSVELYLNGSPGTPLLCPICGGTIEGQPVADDSMTHEAAEQTSTQLDGAEPAPWVETWSKGSLGTVGRFQIRELLGDGGFGQV